MTDNYARIVRDNLDRLYEDLPDDLAVNLSARQEGADFEFKAFGGTCRISPAGIFLNGVEEWGVPGILISLYALNANPEPCSITPLKAYKDFPDSMPYVGAFATHSEGVLVPRVGEIEAALPRLKETLGCEDAVRFAGGDVSFFVPALPKITLCYILYRADEDFPASVTCLFSSNANRFMPMDGLADVGEYMSKAILALL